LQQKFRKQRENSERLSTPKSACGERKNKVALRMSADQTIRTETSETLQPAGRVAAKSLTASNNTRLQFLLEQINRFKTVEVPEEGRKKRAGSALCTPIVMAYSTHRKTARKNISTGVPREQ